MAIPADSIGLLGLTRLHVLLQAPEPDPHLATDHSTPQIMWTVVASLAPVIGAAIWFFGPSAVLVIGAATAGAVMTERVFWSRGSLQDGSGILPKTGLCPSGHP